LLRRSLVALLAASLAAAPLAAQPDEAAAPPAEEQSESRGLEGEVLGYLALPVLAVLVAAIGFALGGGNEEQPASP